jgi:hypothetical protein
MLCCPLPVVMAWPPDHPSGKPLRGLLFSCTPARPQPAQRVPRDSARPRQRREGRPAATPLWSLRSRRELSSGIGQARSEAGSAPTPPPPVVTLPASPLSDKALIYRTLPSSSPPWPAALHNCGQLCKPGPGANKAREKAPAAPVRPQGGSPPALPTALPPTGGLLRRPFPPPVAPDGCARPAAVLAAPPPRAAASWSAPARRPGPPPTRLLRVALQAVSVLGLRRWRASTPALQARQKRPG